MRLAILTALTMIAFAANSVLNRMAVEHFGMDPADFALIRVLAGAVTLAALALGLGRGLPLLRARRLVGAVALGTYMIGFSMAYLTLDAGLGALILFGSVQMSMFGLSALRGSRPTRRQQTGAAVALAGLAFVLWPGGPAEADPVGAGLMALAGLGWAFYTLAGRTEPDALGATAANFVCCVPLVALAAAFAGDWQAATVPGVALAIVSGGVTSGLGYALWYAVLPRLDAALAATVQLSVPLIALAGGLVLLGEGASLRLVSGAGLVILGIALTLRRPA